MNAPEPRAAAAKDQAYLTIRAEILSGILPEGERLTEQRLAERLGLSRTPVREAIGRLISYILRLTSPIEARERMREVVRQLAGIGGGRSLGFGPFRVRSLPDGVGKVLDEYLREKEGLTAPGAEKAPGNGGNGGHGGHLLENEAATSKHRIGDLCPECGQAAVVNEEGCRKCYACGYSEC